MLLNTNDLTEYHSITAFHEIVTDLEEFEDVAAQLIAKLGSENQVWT